MMASLKFGAFASILSAAGLVRAQAVSPYSIASDDAIKQTASTIAWDLVKYYHGNESGQVPGILPGPPPAGPYYWWEGGAMWGTLIDYWHLTGDSTYNDIVMQGMLWQTGDNDDYMPLNATLSLGNDDQCFWGMSAMLAAEEKFPNPPDDKAQWLALAQAVFNTQAAPDRHDDLCGGGLHWQIPLTNGGYNYKNSIANGCFFNMGARLARYTNNQTYADWADKTWDWIASVGFLDSKTYAIYDGADVETNCTDIHKAEFSYNNAIWALGAAYMYNYTNGDPKWEDRVNKLITHGLSTFFHNDIAYEPACESTHTCTTDMLSFKGYLHRWYATMTQVAPFTAAKVLPVLRTSAAAAIKQCNGGDFGRQCGFSWISGTYDSSTGAGQEMNVLGAVSSLLITEVGASVTQSNGGISKGNPNAGSKSDNFQEHVKPITTADRAGAGILTIIILGSACGIFGWMSLGV